MPLDCVAGNAGVKYAVELCEVEKVVKYVVENRLLGNEKETVKSCCC